MNHRASLTVRDCVGLWLEAKRPTIRESTWTDYTEKAKRWIIPRLGRTPVVDLRPEHLVRLYRVLQERGLSSRTLCYVHQVLRQTLEHAVRLRLILFNPAWQVRAPSYRRKRPARLGPTELLRFLEVARDDQHGALWLLLVTSGMRPCEAVALRWDDLDHDRALLRIDGSLRFLPNGSWGRHPLRLLGQKREITLPTGVLSVLRDHRSRQEQVRTGAGPAWVEHGFIFADATGRPVRWARVSGRHFASLLRKAGLPVVSAFSLRHSHITTLLQRGTDPRSVSRQAGYASLARMLSDHELPLLPDGRVIAE